MTHTETRRVRRYVLNIIDAIVWPNDALALEKCIKAAAAICHQDQRNMLLVYMPVKHQQCDDVTLLKNQRILEDKLLTAKLNIFRPISIHYFVHDEHGSEKRQLSHFARACHSSEMGDTAWSLSEPMRGKLGPMPLVKLKDMEGFDQDCKMQPKRRAAQRGIEAWKIMLQSFLGSMNLTHADKVIIVDHNVRQDSAGTLELPKAVHQMQLENMTGNANAPVIAFCGGSTDASVVASVVSSLSGVLLEEWWNKCPDAGPAQRPSSSSSVSKPSLKALAFAGETPVFPPALMQKFQPNTMQHNELVKFHAEHTQKYPKIEVPAPSPLALGNSPCPPPNGGGGGPDYAVDPPKSLDEPFDLASRPLEELQLQKVAGLLQLCPAYTFFCGIVFASC